MFIFLITCAKASKAVLRYVGISNPEQEQLIREIEDELGEPDPETLAQFIEAGFAEAPESTSGAAAQ